MCDDCLRQFDNKQGLGSYRSPCKAAIVKQAEDEALYIHDIQDTHSSTVFVSKKGNSSPGDGGMKRKNGCDEEWNRTRKDLRMMDKSSVI